ncbi:MAG TPA: biotin--[acetyl-CoA-carboxylase] ligase [Acidobacteriaceae bacterium]|nr:biotin--[acetyl-CoA-carboxylase] ligase [Acidobacteriaceae bacterium]
MPDTFDIPAIDAALAGTRFGGRLHHFASIDSTSDLAMAEGARGQADGTVYVADEQTAGRGRGDHTWHSEPNNGLYVSALLRPQVAPADALWLSLIAGIAVHDAVLQVTGLAADIRWPNDLLLGPQKFGGILTELNAEATRVRYAVIGIGINVNHAQFPGELAAQATSLRIAASRAWARQPVLISLLKALDREVNKLTESSRLADQKSAQRDILIRFEAISSWVRGKRVYVSEDSGYTGVTAGLDEHGFLLVDTTRGLRRVLSGGVRSAGEGEKE